MIVITSLVFFFFVHVVLIIKTYEAKMMGRESQESQIVTPREASRKARNDTE